MVKKIFAQAYLWILLLLLYSPIVIIVIYSFTEAKVLGNWTGFSTKLYTSLFTTGTHHSLMNALINTITIALLAATASTLLGSVAAIGIFNLKSRSRKAISFVNSIPYSERRYHHGYFAFPFVCFFRNHTRIHNRSACSYYFLYAIRCFERSASFEADEPEYL